MKHRQGRRQSVCQRYFTLVGSMIFNLVKFFSGQIDEGVCIKIFAHGSFGVLGWQIDSKRVISLAASPENFPYKLLILHRIIVAFVSGYAKLFLHYIK